MSFAASRLLPPTATTYKSEKRESIKRLLRDVYAPSAMKLALRSQAPDHWAKADLLGARLS